MLFFCRDDIVQISIVSGHKRNMVKVINIPIYVKIVNTDIGQVVDRQDRVGKWKDVSIAKYRLGRVITDCTVWGEIDVKLHMLISKWEEEGIDIGDQRRMARAFLDNVAP